MTEQLIENVWNPIKLGQGGGYNITNYAVSTSWYNKVIENDGSRFTKLIRYNDADKKSIEISRALDIIAEDISSCNADDNPLFYLDFDLDFKFTQTYITLLNSALKVWSERTKFKTELFQRVRKTLKYGATFYEKNKDGTLSELQPERFVGYVVSDEDEDVVTHYLYDAAITRIDGRGRRKYGRSGGLGSSSEDLYQFIPIDNLVIMKVGEGPFGESVIESVYKTWKQLDLLEQSVVVYRVVRAPERRVYYIDVGNLQGPKREAAIEKQRLRLMQKNVARNSSVEAEYDPHSTGENIFIPTNSTGKGSRVETLSGGQNLGEVGDLEWFANKMAAGLRIPHSMIDTQNKEKEQFNDMRVGQLYQVEFRYLGHVNRLKLPIEMTLGGSFKEFCLERDIEVKEGVTFHINESMSFAKYKEIEVNQSLLNVFTSTTQIESLSKRYALEKFMQLDQEDIQDNEIAMLKEKGLSDEQIKELPDHVTMNIVYGDGRLGEEYGIPKSDGMGRF